jgi:hypothetical protein
MGYKPEIKGRALAFGRGLRFAKRFLTKIHKIDFKDVLK